MAIDLFPHNQEAYEAVLDMVEQIGKAAIIHPTGTGKSFIAFKICEQFPEKRVCWVSPSEYIFRTQLENLKKVCNGYQPDNIRYYTYSKLMSISHDEMTCIHPDYIILDEFHRCGAQMWGTGVYSLLKMYPHAAVIGLSATNVRYLDGQRDMAVELFSGNIASQMSLGEAIVRGILPVPKYILAGFQFQGELDKYRLRIHRIKSKAARDEAENHLEALRRALENADGLDIVFHKHMDKPCGKYIVFCANYEHMKKMIEVSSAWFSRVDPEPHVYYAYSDDPSTDKEFAAFKLDNSNHLKLLFCIDMLNEGVHVDDIDGVILLRPTVSPIIYKQQIGRALSAGNRRTPIIFDIVLNINNLYSVDAIKEEMDNTIFLYRQFEQEHEIVHEQFHVVDELCNCLELFDRLNDSLTASWELMYQAAYQYYLQFGNLEVPRRYVTSEGYCLGSWIATQRKVYARKCPGNLSSTQIERLEKINMRWGDLASASWNFYYAELCKYRNAYGNLDILSRYRTADGLQLGKFVSQLRTCRATGRRNAYLTPERIAALDQLGMIWGKVDFKWDSNYQACARYKLEHGNLNIPASYISKDGLKIGSWIRRQRKLRFAGTKGVPLTESQIQRLNDIGMVWEDSYEAKWEAAYEHAVRYYQLHGNLDVPTTYVDETGFALGRWVKRHRATKRDGSTQIKITPERKSKLDALGMKWL